MVTGSPLAAKGVAKRFRGNVAIEEVSFEAATGEILGLVGPNGSGKTTLLNICNGVYRPDRGTIEIDGRSVRGARPPAIAARGVSRTFQAPRVFDSLSVLQNLRLTLLHHHGTKSSEIREKAAALLESVKLERFLDATASELSGGQRKLVEYCRALMSAPKILLMDEPFAGVHPAIKETMVAAIEQHRSEGVTFVIVSHELPLMTKLVDRMLCLAEGRVIAEGTAREVCGHPDVIRAYLGGDRTGDG